MHTHYACTIDSEITSIMDEVAVVCRLIRHKSLGMYPRPDIITKYEKKKIFLRRLPLNSFLAKTLRVNTPAMKKFLKNLSYGVNVKLYIPPLTYKLNAHNMRGVRS